MFIRKILVKFWFSEKNLPQEGKQVLVIQF